MRTTTAKLLWLAAINVFVIGANDDQPFDDHEGAAVLIDGGKDGAVYGAFAQHAIGKFEKPTVQDIEDLWENWYKDYLRNPEGEITLVYKHGQGSVYEGLGVTEAQKDVISSAANEASNKVVFHALQNLTDHGDKTRLTISPGDVIESIAKEVKFKSHGELFLTGYLTGASMHKLKNLDRNPILQALVSMRTVAPDAYNEAVKQFIEDHYKTPTNA